MLAKRCSSENKLIKMWDQSLKRSRQLHSDLSKVQPTDETDSDPKCRLGVGHVQLRSTPGHLRQRHPPLSHKPSVQPGRFSQISTARRKKKPAKQPRISDNYLHTGKEAHLEKTSAAMSTSADVMPKAGTFPVRLSPALFQSTSKKRKREDQDVIALRCRSILIRVALAHHLDAFKPVSMTSVKEASISSSNGSRVLRADTVVS